MIRPWRRRHEHPIFARFYDRMIAGSERAGLAEMRRSLLARASGRTLEIGAGTGLDLAHYTEAVTELVLAEPDPHMAARLRERVESESFAPGRITVIEAPRRGSSLRRRQLRHGRLGAGPVHGRGSRARAGRGPPRPGRRAASCSSSSTSAPRAGAWPGGRTACERPWGAIAGRLPSQSADRGHARGRRPLDRAARPRALPEVTALGPSADQRGRPPSARASGSGSSRVISAAPRSSTSPALPGLDRLGVGPGRAVAGAPPRPRRRPSPGVRARCRRPT